MGTIGTSKSPWKGYVYLLAGQQDQLGPLIQDMRTIPLPLRQILPVEDLLESELSPKPAALGSFWAESNKDLQSRVVKYFKHPTPPLPDNSAALALIEAYADIIAERVNGEGISFVVRVLAGKEKKPDPLSPLSILARTTAERLGVPVKEPFFRTESRKSMREIQRLSGTDTIRQRIQYILQDLCIVPDELPGKALLLDDIYNLGASARIYSTALKRCCKTDDVISFNLAATRFNGGKDGWGRLVLDVPGLMALMSRHLPYEHRYLVESAFVCKDTMHKVGCPHAVDPVEVPTFIAPAGLNKCPDCFNSKPDRTLWQRIFGSR